MLQIWGNVYLASSKFVKIFSAKKLNKQKKNPKLTKKTHKQQQKKPPTKNPPRTTIKKIHNTKKNLYILIKWVAEKSHITWQTHKMQSLECVEAVRAADTAHEVIATWGDPGATPTEKQKALQFHSDCL